MQMTLIDSGEHFSHLRLVGRMDPGAAHTIRERFRNETIGRKRPVVVDVSEVPFITSVGIGMIVDCANTMRKQGLRFVIVAPDGRVSSVLRTTGVYAIAANACSVEDAITMLTASDEIP